jgi:K+ transporter
VKPRKVGQNGGSGSSALVVGMVILNFSTICSKRNILWKGKMGNDTRTCFGAILFLDLNLVITIKYVILVLKADHEDEGEYFIRKIKINKTLIKMAFTVVNIFSRTITGDGQLHRNFVDFGS